MAAMFWVDLTFEWYEDGMVFRLFIFIFLFRTNVIKGYLDESVFRHCYGIFPKVSFWKLLDHNYVQSSLISKIVRHIENSILKKILPLKTLRTWIKICVNTFKTWANIMKRKSTKVPWKLSLTKNTTPHFKEYCTRVDDI